MRVRVSECECECECRLDDHHHVQSAHLPRNLRFEVKPLRSPAPVTKSRNLDHQNTRFPLRLPRKVITMCENAHGATARAQSRQALTAAAQISRACAVEMHFEDFERHECTVNSSELAVNARAPQRSKHSCLTTTVRTPKCLHTTVWGIYTYIYIHA